MFSDLVSNIVLSPNCNEQRYNDVCKITPHHAAWVDASGTAIANSFVPESRGASSNYCIGVEGDIVGCVPEESRAWTSSSSWNDNQAITIEVANDGAGGTDWHISDESWESLVNLCVDICRRYDFVLDYTGDKDGSLTAHRFFAATACPGDYLFSKFQELADEVNERLAPEEEEIDESSDEDNNNEDTDDEETDVSLEGWVKQDDTWYYYNDGDCVKDDWVKYNNKWYYLDNNGEMKTNSWIKWNDKWCYVMNDGVAYCDGWKQIDNKWYYFDKDGYMLDNQWIQNDSGTWSYVGENGAATTGWRELKWKDETHWYLFDDNGTMCFNKWSDNYFVGGDGAMLTNIWVGHNNEYYWVGNDGKWIDKPSWKSKGNPNDGYPIYVY